VDFLKSVRQIFRKFENFVPLTSNERQQETSELKHFNKIPTTGTKYKARCPESTDAWGSSKPFFFRSLESSEEEWESEIIKNDYPCFVCTHPNKVKHFWSFF